MSMCWAGIISVVAVVTSPSEASAVQLGQIAKSSLLAHQPAQQELLPGYVASSAAQGTISYAKSMPNGSAVNLAGQVVTFIIRQPGTSNIESFYVQERRGVAGPDGKRHDYSGIRIVLVNPANIPIQPGDVVQVAGSVVGGAAYPECYVLVNPANGIVKIGTAPIPAAVGMPQKLAAGGPFGLQSRLYRQAVTPTAAGDGLNAVGVRIKLWGRLLWGGIEGSNYVYYIDDGSGLTSNAQHVGMKVVCRSGVPMPGWQLTQPPQFVEVMGALGAETGSNGLYVPVLRADSTPPTAPVVTDDGDQNMLPGRIHATWTACADSESGIDRYEYAIGVAAYPQPGWDSARHWTSVGTATEVTAAGLSLTEGQVYYVSVRAVNGSGVGSVGVSDGIIMSGQFITGLTGPGSTPMYDKYEAAFAINQAWTGAPVVNFNPFSPKLLPTGTGAQMWRKKGIYVDAIVTKPDGSTFRWPCFYDYSRGWKLRLAPTMLGLWSYCIEVRYRTGSSQTDPIDTVRSATRTFTCVQNNNQITRRGFLRKDATDSWFFSFSNADFASSADDTVFYPVGVKCNGTTDIDRLASHGGAYSRLFRSSYMFEEYYPRPDRVNDFQENKALWWDNFIETARIRGVYLIYLLNNWTYWKSQTENPYIVEGVATDCADAYNPSNKTIREVYKRKLRFMLARWGYSTSIIGFDLINETDQGGGKDFHSDMARFVNGDVNAVPAEWPVKANDAEEQPHHLSGDQTSCEYRTKDVQWDDPAIGMCHFHDYACSTEYWNGIRTDIGGGWDKLGCTHDRPWFDTAVWMDRAGVKQRQLVAANSGYAKPFSWSEMGLANAGHTGDWNDAYFGSADGGATYAGDTGGQHARDWFWASIFNKISGCHWHTEYFNGTPSNTARPGYGVTQWWIFRPLFNFLNESNHPIDMRGMKQESYYPPPHTVANPRIACSDPQVGVYSVLGATQAYLYVKNLTSTWYQAAGFTHPTLPEPRQIANVTITLSGLNSGLYRIQKWSTIDTNPSTQMKVSQTIAVASGENLTFQVTLEASGDYAWAYKIFRL